MPEAYLKIKHGLKRRGLSDKEAKARAAAIYNTKHPDAPVGPHYEKRVQRRKQAD